MLAQEIMEFKWLCATLGFTCTNANRARNRYRSYAWRPHETLDQSASKLVDIARVLVLNNHPDGYLMPMLAQETT